MARQRQRVQYSSDLPSRTQQHLKEECNVNSILEKYRRTGSISHVRGSPGVYGDFSGLGDLRTNLEKVQKANESFAALPAHVRKRFGNDPGNLIDFLSDTANNEEALKLGLLEPQPAATQAPTNDDKTTNEAPPANG